MKIMPSIMSAKPWDVKKYVKKFEECDIPMIHYDVMDGSYVPNISLGTYMYSSIHEITKIPLGLHLMVNNPDVAIDYFNVLPGDYVSFHPETIEKPAFLLNKIRAKQAKAGIVLSPGISVDYVKELANDFDFVLIMGVNPGFSGQKMLPDTVEKVTELNNLKTQGNWDFEIFVDGDCSPANCKKVVKAGANGCVVGSALINPDSNPLKFESTYKKYLEIAK